MATTNPEPIDRPAPSAATTNYWHQVILARVQLTPTGANGEALIYHARNLSEDGSNLGPAGLWATVWPAGITREPKAPTDAARVFIPAHRLALVTVLEATDTGYTADPADDTLDLF